MNLETTIEKRLKAEGVQYASTLAALVAIDVAQEIKTWLTASLHVEKSINEYRTDEDL